ncbi:hypothetical protein QQ056_19455 [Oscillatoria laete-virens NRMC-F 0139]|nr:hypothetical protein [Oscillatoria laete-virens]MDL5055709.1 hypothetical protein [Oscillatoria laete-virens NRMC-F 0139]
MRNIVTACCLVCLFMLGATAAEGEAREVNKDNAGDIPVWGKHVTVAGKVTAKHSWQMDSGTNHLVVKIKGEDGEIDIVDLGAEESLKSTSIDATEGKTLYISGRVGKLNDQPCVMAETISENKFVTVDRRNERRGARMEKAAAELDKKAANETAAKKDADHSIADHKGGDQEADFHLVEGRVENTRMVKIEGQNEERLFVRLSTDSGMVVVDLGDKTKVKVDTSVGQSIVAAGFVYTLNERPFLRAHAVGNMTSVERQKVGATP